MCKIDSPNLYLHIFSASNVFSQQFNNRPGAISRPSGIPFLNPRNAPRCAHLKYASNFPQSKQRLAWSLLMLRQWEYSKQHLWNIYRNMNISLYFNYLFYTRGTITIKWAHCRKVTQCSFTEIMVNILNLFCCSADWKRNQWKDLFRVKPHPLILNAAQSTCTVLACFIERVAVFSKITCPGGPTQWSFLQNLYVVCHHT